MQGNNGPNKTRDTQPGMRPRAVFMGNPGYGGLVLEALLAEEVEVVAVFHTGRTLRDRARRTYRRYLRTAKSRREILPRLREKVVTFRDEPYPVEPFGKDVIDIAGHRGIPLYPGSFVHAQECPDTLRRLEVDVLLVATFSELLPASLLVVPRLAAINMHPSLLPAYRGGFPEFCAIYDGVEKTGVTFHLMTERFDTGNILFQTELRIPPAETTRGLKAGLAELACDAIPALVGKIRRGDLKGVPQDDSKKSYTRLRAGFDSIDVSMSVRQIQRLVSACRDVEDIGRPNFERGGRTIFPLSWGESGLAFAASDGFVYFDVVLFQHKLLRGSQLESLESLLA